MKVPASASNNRFALTCNDISVHDSAKAVCHHDGRPVAGSHQSIQSLQHSRELLKPCQPEVQQELLTALLACSKTEAWVHTEGGRQPPCKSNWEAAASCAAMPLGRQQVTATHDNKKACSSSSAPHLLH